MPSNVLHARLKGYGIVLAVLGVLLIQSTPAHAFRFFMWQPPSPAIQAQYLANISNFAHNMGWQNPTPQLQAQYLANLANTANSLRQAPPWLFGVNPFFQPRVFAPGFGGGNPYAPGFGGGFGNPYAAALGSGFANPYAGGFGGGFGGGFNPYTPGGGIGGSNPYSTGGGGLGGLGGLGGFYGTYIPPEGYFLMGAAQVMNAYPNVIKGNEEARILREQANQARIETKKKRLEYELWVRANTPTYTEEQAKVYKQTIKRVQNTNNPHEIRSGKSLNILLDDLRKVKSVKGSDPIPLEEEALKHLNVTSAKGRGNLGLLRNDGRFTWPTALRDNQVVSDEDRKKIGLWSEMLVQKALNGAAPDPNILKDLNNAVDALQDKLLTKVNEIPATQYIEAKRFLHDLNDSRLALERKDAIPYFAFQKWIQGGKTVQEVVDYMAQKGLYFAPAVQGDEAAYQAVNAALAAYDMAWQIASVAPATTKE